MLDPIFGDAVVLADFCTGTFVACPSILHSIYVFYDVTKDLQIKLKKLKSAARSPVSTGALSWWIRNR
jgi:hypothetical protein